MMRTLRRVAVTVPTPIHEKGSTGKLLGALSTNRLEKTLLHMEASHSDQITGCASSPVVRFGPGPLAAPGRCRRIWTWNISVRRRILLAETPRRRP